MLDRINSVRSHAQSLHRASGSSAERSCTRSGAFENHALQLAKYRKRDGSVGVIAHERIPIIGSVQWLRLGAV